MPPKIKITKEEIIEAGVSLVRKSGADSLNARNIAGVLECSTQPIFSNFATMDELRLAVIKKADELCNESIKAEMASGSFPPYKASGMAYIRFAKEEKELFKLLYMRDRSAETYSEESELTGIMEDVVHQNTGLSDRDAQIFHLEMWAYVHGIAAMFATGFLDLDFELVSNMLTDAYKAHRKLYGMEV